MCCSRVGGQSSPVSASTSHLISIIACIFYISFTSFGIRSECSLC